jgi:hypothetical protein
MMDQQVLGVFVLADEGRTKLERRLAISVFEFVGVDWPSASSSLLVFAHSIVRKVKVGNRLSLNGYFLIIELKS